MASASLLSYLGLDDLCVRFIINLPREELESVERICFQVEEAQWFYEDFIRPLDPTLPSLNLRQFCLKIFQHCPLFAGYDDEIFSAAFSEFLAYKTRVPVRGAIMLNEAMDEAVLVKGWKKSASWSFPRGKINKDEKDIDCAIREVYEETGYDIKNAGLVWDEDEMKSIEVTMREQHMKLFVFPGVPKDTHFEPRTRKEISKIEWYKLSDLPALKKTKHQHDQNQEHELSKNASKFYMVAPFMGPLKKYIAQRKKQEAKAKPLDQEPVLQVQVEQVSQQQITIASTDDMGRLMAQLRQSQQASREDNLPEVTDSGDYMKDASLQLKNLLNLSNTAPVQPDLAQTESAARESKAQAMLSLLRGGLPAAAPPPPPRREGAELPPTTPFDQISTIPSQAPPSPKQHPHRVARAPMFTTPSFPFPMVQSQTTHQREPPSATQPPIPGPLLHPPMTTKQPGQAMLPGNAQPPMWRQGLGNPQGGAFLGGDRQATAAPAANKLPLPKLNAHSSKLLDLFKQGPSSPHIPQLPADSPRPELSTSKLADGTPFQPPPRRGVIGEGTRPGHALVSANNSVSLRAGPKTPSQQEALLNLFKGSSFLGRPSASLATSPAPVELAANTESARVGNLTQSVIPPNAHKPRVPTRDISPLAEDEKTPKPNANEGPDLSPDLSATVTGPLDEMHFDSITSPNNKRRSKIPHSPKHLSPSARGSATPKTAPRQQIRILTRPGPSHIETASPSLPQTRSLHSKRSRDTKEPPTSKPTFQPQILKRPTSITNSTTHDLLAPTPKSIPPQILARPTAADTIQPASQSPSSSDQKARLLALFGPRQSETAPIMSASALPISPLSERPDSTLPSPLGGSSRSRIGSLHDVTSGDRVSLSKPDSLTSSVISVPKNGTHGMLPQPLVTNNSRGSVSTVASPTDRTFLLGFLDGIAKEGAR